MIRPLAAAALLALLTLAPPARAAEGKPFQLSLVSPVQVVPEGESVSGLRLSLLYGKNANVSGVDLSLVAAHATGSFTGFQMSLVGLVDGDFLGWQSNLVNLTAGSMKGLQWGLYNRAARVEGLQLGFVNQAGTIRGLQIGLVNIVEKGGWLPVMVIANGNFD
jgi:hypothetical protein